MTNLCKNCILNEHYENISFNKDGVCNYCTDYTRQTKHNIDEDSVLYNLKDNKVTYDVLVAYSGGKDSTYILHQLIKKYKLRVLAFTFENHFISPTTYQNIKNSYNNMQFDHVVLSYDYQFTVEFFKSALQITQENTLRKLFKTFGFVCYPCFVLLAIGCLNIARAYKIRNIVGGWSLGQIENLNWLNPKTNGQFLSYDLIIEHFINPLLNKINLSEIPPQIQCYLENKDNITRRILPYFTFEEYKEDKIYHTIIKELNWQKPKDTDGCSTNCLLNAYGNEIFEKTYKYNRYAEQLSREIRAGNISRDEALRNVNQKGSESNISRIKKVLS